MQGGRHGAFAPRPRATHSNPRKAAAVNFFIISELLGLLLATIGLTMLPSLGWSVYYADGAQGAILGAMGATLAIGACLYGFGRLRRQELYRREATAVVGLGWLLAAFAGALPFYFYGAFPTFADCYFESMSGFTTTGASVLRDFSSLPQGLFFWRSFTHWLGGMGIIVLFVALLPFLGAGGKTLMRYEVPGPVTETLTPRVKDTAVLLWFIYVFLTIAETVALVCCGMSIFDALCNTFGTLATGGFSPDAQSIAGYGSAAVDWVIVFFMILAGTNFSLYYGVIRRRPSLLFKNPEWRVYIGILAAASLFVSIVLLVQGYYDSILSALRYGTFQVVSIMTTTGFVTADFNQWPPTLKCLLVFLMFVGGSAGSTGGGIKVMRWIVLCKAAYADLERVFSPRTVRRLRLGDQTLSRDLVAPTVTFFFIWLMVFGVGSIAIAASQNWAEPPGAHSVELVTIVTSVAATLNNIGPGLGLVGAVENYAFFNVPSKWLLSLFMVLGRLELYTILVLFVPRFWRGR